MKKQSIRFFLATSLLLSGAHAAAQATPAAAVAKVTSTDQWEYLVISFGKTYFSSSADIAAKQSGLSKLMIFGPLGGVSASEALDTQTQVDTLGRYGWELIGILGAIGGDQEWIFKRSFDPDRAAKEAAQIKKEGSELAAARDKAAKEAEAKPAAPPVTELVDLDGQEARILQAAANKVLRDDTASRLQLAEWSVAKLDTGDLSIYTSSYDGKASSMGTATIHLDATQRALEGNTYRRSAVQAMIDEYIKALKSQGRDIVRTTICSDGRTRFKVGASIKFNNEWKDVIYPSDAYCLK